MYRQTATARISTTPLPVRYTENEVVTLQLTHEFEAEVLDFLSERPMHTVAMTGFIRDNGLVSELNRGMFYGCRNRQGKLEGVALIGHATLMETRSDRALQAFADLARQSATPHLIMGEEERIDELELLFRRRTRDASCLPRVPGRTEVARAGSGRSSRAACGYTK
ncbi:MAG: hypothetical protein ACR2IB_10305 [Pyrinomonadaceae bacterium]